MRRMTRHPRADQRPTRGVNNWLNDSLRHPIIHSLRRVATFMGPALLLVAGLLALSGARPLPARANARTSASLSAYAALRPATPKSGGGPDVRHWVDPSNGTAYSVLFHADQQGPIGQFTFTLPSGDQITGGFGDFTDPIQPSPANDGSLVQASPCSNSFPDLGILTPAGEAEGPTIGFPRGSTYQEVRYVLSAHLDASGFMAFATLDYVSVAVTANQATLCTETAPYPYVMQAGCDLSQCRNPIELATQNTQHYDDAVVAAAQNGGAGAWQAVWPLTATLIRGQYSQADFGTAMAQQEQKVGRITQIVNTSAPDVQLDVALQPFFSVTQDVTVSKNGKTTVSSVTSYYLLEGEQWQFWFSAS